MELANVAIDRDKFENGAWWNFETRALCTGNKPHEKDACMLLVYAGANYMRTLEEERKPFLQEIRADRLSEESERIIRGRALARSVVKDWKNFQLDGLPFVYSEDNAVLLMTDIRFTFVENFVSAAVGNEQGYMVAEAEESLGN